MKLGTITPTRLGRPRAARAVSSAVMVLPLPETTTCGHVNGGKILHSRMVRAHGDRIALVKQGRLAEGRG